MGTTRLNRILTGISNGSIEACAIDWCDVLDGFNDLHGIYTISHSKELTTEQKIRLLEIIKQQEWEINHPEMQIGMLKYKKAVEKALADIGGALSDTYRKVEPQPLKGVERLLKIARHPKAEQAINNAIDKGYIIAEADGLKWNRLKVELALFTEILCCPLNEEHYPNVDLCRIFNVNRLDSALTQYHTTKEKQEWVKCIEELFND